MVFGAVLILAALSLFTWNQYEASKAESAVQQIVPQIIRYIEYAEPSGKEPEPPPDPYDPAMTVAEINGHGYVGYLEIPALELSLPVMSEWDYERLKISPCRYAGSAKTNDLVIAAHNYEKHFGRLKDLSAGDTVIFTDMDGIVRHYTVSAAEVLSAEGVEEMTSGEYDLTLFTCTYGGQSRMTVRCVITGAEKGWEE